MAERTLYPEWRPQNAGTRYPFADTASLLTNTGRVLLPGIIGDAIIHPVGGTAGLFLTTVVIDHQSVVFWIGNEGSKQLCSGGFPLVAPPQLVPLKDAYERPAGLIVAGEAGLNLLSAWGAGTHTFARAASEFVASVCIPTPEEGVRGILLDDGSVLTGDVWLLGADGVVLTAGDVSTPSFSDDTVTAAAIIVNVVGDPLFRRRLCEPGGRFLIPRFITAVRFTDDAGSDFTCMPDVHGNIAFTVTNRAAHDTAMRVAAGPGGTFLGVAGAPIG